MTRSVSVVLAASALTLLAPTVPSQGAPPAKDIPVLATFVSEHPTGTMMGVRPDGQGAYSGTIGGSIDFLLNFGFNRKPERNPRFLTLDLSRPVDDGNLFRPVVQASQEVHLNVRRVGTVGFGDSTTETIAGFKWKGSDGFTYRLRYGFPDIDGTTPDGTAKLQVTRTSSDTWVIATPPGDAIGRVWRITNAGEIPLGYYRVPLYIELTADGG